MELLRKGEKRRWTSKSPYSSVEPGTHLKTSLVGRQGEEEGASGPRGARGARGAGPRLGLALKRRGKEGGVQNVLSRVFFYTDIFCKAIIIALNMEQNKIKQEIKATNVLGPFIRD